MSIKQTLSRKGTCDGSHKASSRKVAQDCIPPTNHSFLPFCKYLMIFLFPLFSINVVNAVNVTFANAGCDIAYVYWDNNGSETLIQVLAAGESATQGTFFGHNWVFKNASNTVLSNHVINSISDYTYNISTRDRVDVINNSVCDVTVYCEELDGSYAGQVFNMGTISPGSSTAILPSGDAARIYGIDTDNNTTNELVTIADGNDDFNGCYTLNITNGCNTTEICNNGLDDDGDGLVDCADSDCTESCSDLTCADGVTLLSQAYDVATGSGANGMPAINDLFVPEGNNRIVFLISSFEREHCQSGDDCSNFNYDGTGLGDNWATTIPVTDNFTMSANFAGAGGDVDRQNHLNLPSGDLRFGVQYGYPNSLEIAGSYYSRETYYIAIYENELNTILGGATSGNISITLPDAKLPLDNADDATMMAFVFANVEQSNTGIVRSGTNTGVHNIVSSNPAHSGDFSINIADFDDGQEPDEVNDGLFIYAMSGLGLPTTTGGFNTVSGFEELVELTTNNGTGDYTVYNEGDGISVSAQFRNGPTSGIINNVTIQSSALSSIPANGGLFAAFTLESCACSNDLQEEYLIGDDVWVSGTSFTVCEGEDISLGFGGNGYADWVFEWTGPNGFSSTQTGSSDSDIIDLTNLTSAQSGTYYLTYTEANGCIYNTSFHVTVDPCIEICGNGEDDDGDGFTDCADSDCGGTTVTTSSNTTICAGAGANVSATASGGETPYTFSWSHGLGTGNAKTVNPSATTTYIVTVTNGNGCTSTDQVTVNINPSPVANAGSNQTICRFTSFDLSASVTGGTGPYNFSWSHAPGTGNDLTVTPLNTTTYTVTVTSNNGCVDTDNMTITVQTCIEDCSDGIDNDGDGAIDCADSDCGPSVDLGTDINICPGTSTLLSASTSGGNGAVTYLWSNGSTASSLTVSPDATTSYAVVVTAPSGCTAEAEMTVNVVNCSEDCTNNIDDDGDGLVDCDDPDCMATAAPGLADDDYTTCPGMDFTERVTYNDDNLQNASFSISSQPGSGTVSIDATGKFNFMPDNNECKSVSFNYQACNAASGCCDEATVTIHFGDTQAPTLTNVPVDITISCDDIVPSPPNIVAFDECPGIYVDFEESSNQHFVGACESYTITRKWTAYDLCGNSTSGEQQIAVLDNTKPEIFQVYTLENGKRIVAGVSQKVSHEWKYIPFPITFTETPMIFTTVTSNNDFGAVTVRQRNAYSQGFEIKLFEEENADGKHQAETVSWIAVESGINDAALKLEAGRWDDVDHTFKATTFSNIFGNSPGLLTSIQSTNEEDPASIRIKDLTNSGVSVKVQEEKSLDNEELHTLEHIGYLAFKAGEPLVDNRGQSFAETGNMSVTNAWATVSLTKNYTKPVIVFGGPTYSGADPVNVRVRNVSSNSFEVRIQEWDYLDGNHNAETVSWMVVEGSIPGNMGYYCSGSASDLEVGVNVFAMDNCDDQTSFGYSETPSVTAGGTLTTRAWMAIDDCGNTNLITRFDTCSTAALEVKALLHGAMVNNGGNIEMRDDLREEHLVPLEEPFSNLPAFDHVTDTTPDEDEDDDQTGQEDQTADLPTNAGIAYFKTIADGAWDDAATWVGGNIPNLSDTVTASISIEHMVNIPSGNLYMSHNSELFVTNGGLHLEDGDLKVFEASAYFTNSTIQVSKTMANYRFFTSHSDVFIKDCDVTVGGYFINGGGKRKMENVCLNVGLDYDNSAGLDTLNNVQAVVKKSILNNLLGKMHITNTKLHSETGSIYNSWSGKVTGDSILVWIQDGGISNVGTWEAHITRYCSANSVSGIGNYLAISEDCAGMPDIFSTCVGWIQPTIIDGGTGQGPAESDELTAYEISLEGTMEPTLLVAEGSDAVVDWLLLELRDVDTEEVIEYATVVLQADGDIVSEDGEPVINFPTLLEGDYFVTLRHRNHLPIMTDVPMYLSILNPPTIDFTDPTLPVRGGNVGGLELSGTRRMWGGDFNEDDKVIYQGPNNDVFYLFSRVLGDLGNAEYLANYIVRNYDAHDFNLDGKVIYQGPNNDRASLLYHSVLSHGGNGGFLANYIVKGNLP